MKNYLIIGNGVAGTTAAEQIRILDSEGEITIVTDEFLPFYSRIRLPEFIAKEINEDRLIIKKDDWYKKLNIKLKLNSKIIKADAEKKFLETEGGKKFFYDVLLIATGSRSFVPPIRGSEKNGVFTLRNVEDAQNISAYAQNTENVVLIGGGLLGLECGNALRKMGKKVSVVEFFPRLLPRQLDDEGAKRLKELMEDMGFSFRLGAKTKEIIGEKTAKSVLLESDEELLSKMVIISAGVRPNLEMAWHLNLRTDKGILVDDYLKTSCPDIFAAGDVAEHKGMLYGIWPASKDQGLVAGINMAGGSILYKGTEISNKLKVAGIDLASAGNIDSENHMESLVLKKDDIYKKMVFNNDKIAGCIMLGNTKGFDQIVKAMSLGKDVSKIKNDILGDDFDFKKL